MLILARWEETMCQMRGNDAPFGVQGQGCRRISQEYKDKVIVIYGSAVITAWTHLIGDQSVIKLGEAAVTVYAAPLFCHRRVRS